MHVVFLPPVKNLKKFGGKRPAICKLSKNYQNPFTIMNIMVNIIKTGLLLMSWLLEAGQWYQYYRVILNITFYHFFILQAKWQKWWQFHQFTFFTFFTFSLFHFAGNFINSIDGHDGKVMAKWWNWSTWWQSDKSNMCGWSRRNRCKTLYITFVFLV